MKRLGKGLFDKIVDIDNIRLADEKAQQGKASRPEVIEHNEHREQNIIKIHDMLISGTYKPSKYRNFCVHEPKERVISALPYYPDRIIHHAIMNILEPTWKHTFTYNSYACIKGRGITACMKRVRRIIDTYTRQNRQPYCLKIDIRHFYPSVNGEIMKTIIRKKIKCARTLALLDTIIDSAEGLPIGNYTSQYLANLYLAYFMHTMTDTIRVDCVEYSDDIIFFSDSKDYLHDLLKNAIVPHLNTLGLIVKPNYQVFPVKHDRYDTGGRLLDFVGYTFGTGCTGLRKRTKERFARKTARLRKHGIKGKRLFIKTSSYTGWCKHADCISLAKHILGKEQKHIKWLNKAA